MDDVQKILQQFRLNITAFLDELVDKFPRDEWLIRDRVYFTTRVDIKDTMDCFVWYLTKCKDAITKRDDIFFLNNTGTFMDKLDPEHFKQFKRIWRSGLLDDVDRATIWKWVDAFVFFADRYKKCIHDKSTFVSNTPIALPSINIGLQTMTANEDKSSFENATPNQSTSDKLIKVEESVQLQTASIDD
jgi:hypothetical protein